MSFVVVDGEKVMSLDNIMYMWNSGWDGGINITYFNKEKLTIKCEDTEKRKEIFNTITQFMKIKIPC